MKIIIALLSLLALAALANAAPEDRPLRTRFGQLDKTSPEHAGNVAAICAETLHDLRETTFTAASLEDSISVADALKKPVNPDAREKLKKLHERIVFDNDDYAKNCL